MRHKWKKRKKFLAGEVLPSQTDAHDPTLALPVPTCTRRQERNANVSRQNLTMFWSIDNETGRIAILGLQSGVTPARVSLFQSQGLVS